MVMVFFDILGFETPMIGGELGFLTVSGDDEEEWCGHPSSSSS